MEERILEIMKPFYDKQREMTRTENGETIKELKSRLESLENQKETEIEEYVNNAVNDGMNSYANGNMNIDPGYVNRIRRDLEASYKEREDELKREIEKTKSFNHREKVYMELLDVSTKVRQNLYKEQKRLETELIKAEIAYSEAKIEVLKLELVLNNSAYSKDNMEKYHQLRENRVQAQARIQQIKDAQDKIRECMEITTNIKAPRFNDDIEEIDEIKDIQEEKPLDVVLPEDTEEKKENNGAATPDEEDKNDEISTEDTSENNSETTETTEENDENDKETGISDGDTSDNTSETTGENDNDLDDDIGEIGDDELNPPDQDIPPVEDEEPVKVVKTRVCDWIKSHKKQILIALGLTAIAIALVVIVTQLLPALLAAQQATQTAGLLSQMLSNGQLWFTSSLSEQAMLHSANTALASQVTSLTGMSTGFSASSGLWTIGGQALPSAAKAAITAALKAQTATKVATGISLGLGAVGLGGLGSGLLIGNKSESYKKYSAELKSLKENLSNISVEDLNSNLESLSEQITNDNSLKDKEKQVLLKKIKSLLRKKGKEQNMGQTQNGLVAEDLVVPTLQENDEEVPELQEDVGGFTL